MTIDEIITALRLLRADLDAEVDVAEEYETVVLVERYADRVAALLTKLEH